MQIAMQAGELRRPGGAAARRCQSLRQPAGRPTKPDEDQPPPSLSPQQDTQNSRRINKAGQIPGESTKTAKFQVNQQSRPNSRRINEAGACA